MNPENGPGNTPLLLQGAAMAFQNLAATAVAPGISPTHAVCLMSGAAEQDSGSSAWPPHNLPAPMLTSTLVPALPGIAGDSDDDVSIQFAPSDFLSLGRGSNVAANDMALDPSTVLAVPVNCSSEHPRIHLQPNASDAEAPRIGIQANDSQQSSAAAAADLSDSHRELQSAIPANTNNELASLLAEGVTDQNMQTYQQTREKLKTQSQLNAHTLPSAAAAVAFKENEEAPARKVKSRRKKHRAKVIHEDKKIKKQKPAVATPEGKPPNQKAKRSYVRKKRNLSSLENCSGPVSDQPVSTGVEDAARSRAASVRRRLQSELCEQGVLRGKSSAGNSCHHIEERLIHARSSFCSTATVSTVQGAHGLHVDMENSPGGLAFGMICKMNKLLDEYIHLPEMAIDCTQEVTPATSGREPTRKQSVGSTHDLDATRIEVTILEGNNKDLEVNDSNKAGFAIHRSTTSVPETTSTESQMTKVSRVERKKRQQRIESETSLASSRDSIILRTAAQMLAFCQATGIKKKRTVRVRRISYVPIMNVEMNRAQVLPRSSQSCLEALYERPSFKLLTKKRSPRKRRHYHRSEATGRLSNSLVPFGSQMIIPYERPLDLVKNQRPRAKVDLDFETTRVWNLLMGKATDEPVDENDVEKERWWQQEREVFQGRANLFVERMRLFQGDRHFSPWKGSVVDSVVGVFLTQNVSDNLSSSAYMALAASFPPGTVNSNCKKDIISQNYEEIISTSAVGGVRMFDCFDNGARPGLRENFKELSMSNEKIPVETKKNASDYELTKGERYSFYSKEANEDLCDHQETEIDPKAQQFPDLSIELITSERSSRAIQFQKDMSSSQSVRISETILQSQLSLSSGDNYSPNSSVGSVGGAASQQLGSNFDSLAGNDASTKELECQRIKTTTIIDDDASQHRIPSTFEVSDFQEHESLSVTGGTIAETTTVDESTVKSGFPSYNGGPDKAAKPKKTRTTKENSENFDWDELRRQACADGHMKERKSERRDSVDWEAVRCADVQTISHTIRARGINNVLAGRIQEFVNRLVKDHGTIDLEWLRDTPPDAAKDYLLSIHGLGLKSVECVRLLTLHQLAFPVDTNVGRICVRLGWVPIQPLPESLQLHLLELYPVLETVQKYLWPRLCKLDQKTLYELHYHMITFGKVFCTKTKPNCNACPMRSECRHFASAFTSARLALPAPQEKSLVKLSNQFSFQSVSMPSPKSTVLPQLEESTPGKVFHTNNSQPIIEEPASPTREEHAETLESDIEDYDPDTGEIPLIKLNLEAFAHNLENCIKESNMDLRSDDIEKALVAISTEAAIPVPKLKNVRRLRTEHYVYEIPDSHSLVQQLGLHQREDGDPSPYLLTIWMQDDINAMIKAPKPCSNLPREDGLCNNEKCQHCVLERENQSRYVRATILVPCRTGMKGSFPLNGTYFQVNEVFADHKSSHDPIYVVRKDLWPLERRMVYFGTSVPSIFKGLTTEEIQQCFWKGFVCVRGFERETGAPRPLCQHLHVAASKVPRRRNTAAAAAEQDFDSAQASAS